ncbi:hypothetical protein BC830DRAFT_1173209 [Chytriomyces sp. MP71]|nr:hypothetical protein BC830DRAFT_1173209 [Chytriomyces sp. MP71]
MLDTHVKEMKLLSRNIASANEDAVYELDANDEPISTNLNVREAMRRYVALKHIPVPQASRDFDPQVTQMWDQFGIFFLQSVSRFLNSKSLSLTMHLSGSYGRGFKRVHVSSIIETVQEKIPGLLKLPKHGKVKIIAGLLAQEEADDDVDEV